MQDIKYNKTKLHIGNEVTVLHVFSNENTTYLFQPQNATSVLLDKTLADTIQNGEISAELLSKFSQRGILFPYPDQVENIDNKKPYLFMIDLTNTCQNRCLYCFRKLEQGKHIEDTQLIGILNYIIQYCKINNLQQISIQPWGGEPLLEWERIKYIQDCIQKNGVKARIIIETNGIAITPQMAKELFERNISISVSIDGHETIHNAQRPLCNSEGSFKVTLRGYHLLQEAGYENKIGIVCVITKKSLPHIKEIIRFFAFDLQASRVKINIIKDSEQLSDKGLALNETDIENFDDQLYNAILELNQQGISFGEAGIVERLHNLLDRKIINLCSSRGCQAHHRIFSFNMEGNIYPCDQIDTNIYQLGNINQKIEMTQLISQQKDNPFYKQTDFTECKDCLWWYFCKGGCTAMRLLKKTNIDKTECRRNQNIYPKLIQLILNYPNLISSITNNEIEIV